LPSGTAVKEIGGRQEVGVEHGDEFTLGGLQAVVQGAGLVARAIRAVDVSDGTGDTPGG